MLSLARKRYWSAANITLLILTRPSNNSAKLRHPTCIAEGRAGRGAVERRIARGRSGRYGSDRTPHCGQRRLIVEGDLAKGAYTQIIPKSRQIALNRLRSHLLIEFGQHGNSCG